MAQDGNFQDFQESKIKEEWVESSKKKNEEDNKGQEKEIKNEG